MLIAFADDDEPLETVNVVLATALCLDDPVRTAIASTVAEEDSVKGPAYCCVVPDPGVGVLPSVV